MTLLWLDDPGATPVSEPATRRERYFEAGEREVLSVTARIPEEYDAYDLQLWVSELDVEIENDGGSGRIGVSVLEGDRTVDETEVPIEAGESVSVAFDGDAEIAGVDFDVEARPAS